MRKHAVLDQRLVSAFGDPVLARDAVLYFANAQLHYDDEHRYESKFYGRRLLTLEKGRIVEDGSHDDLVQSGGHYADLLRMQVAS